MRQCLTISLTFIGILLTFASGTPIQVREDQFGKPVDSDFDYVVVGGGTAGLTIAARLAEFASVAVIEAGGFYQVTYGNRSVVPLYSLTKIDVIDPTINFPRRPEIDWELVTTPQTNANMRVLHYAQGKTFGGSTALNTMSYIRSTKGAYQHWADLVGDSSYTFENLLPFFKKSVRMTPPNLEKRNAANATPEYDASDFGNGSPLDVSWNNWVDPTITWLAKSLQAIGIPINPKGFSSGELMGAAWVPSTIDPAHATRESAQTSFLDYAMENTQLKVYPYTLATKITFEGTTATGVKVNTNGTSYTLHAKQEVILSAGTFNSPKLLMLSGIGPEKTLNSLNISVISDLPGVGKNLQDPVLIRVGNFVDTPSGQTFTDDPATEPDVLRQYQTDASGPYSSAAGYMCYEKFPPDLRGALSNETRDKIDSFPSDLPDAQYLAASFLDPNGTTMGVIGAVITKTFSRGSVTIASSNYSDNPVIDLGWFSDPADGELLIAEVKRMRQAWNSAPALSIRLGPENIPGDNVDTDEEILQYIKNNANMNWHASSTCSMGKQGDKSAVVDSEAKVFGVSRLRVVDFSIVPYALPGHPQATVYALAEKIAEDITRDR